MRHLVTLALLLLPTIAAADSLEARATPPSTYDVGFRIGGYGFRRANGPDWDECRMNGFGVFGSRALRGPLYLEAGLDAYFTKGDARPTDLPIDRESGLVSMAVGARTQFASWARGYLQLGAGMELTRVSVTTNDTTLRDNKVMPEGFFGVGIDLRVARGTYLGMSLRTLVMGNFDYDPAKLMNQWAPKPEILFDASPDVAAQGQFYVRRDL